MRRPAVCAALCLACAACSGPSAPHPPTAVGEPPVEIDLARTETQIAALLERLRAAVLESPADAGARGALGMACEVSGLLHAAERSYEQARALAPHEPRWSYYLAQVLAELGRLDEALVAMDEALAAAPEYVPAHLRRGNWLLDLGRVDEAALAFATAARLDAQQVYATIGLARVHLKRGEPSEALRLLEPVAAGKRPGDAYAHQLLGLAYRQAGDLERARAELAAGRPDARPRWIDPWHEMKTEYLAGFGADMIRARTMLAQGRVHEALPIFERLREQRPNDLALLNNLSVAYRGAGREDVALQVLLDAVELHPDYYPFHMNLGAAYQRTGDLDRAMHHFDRAIELNPALGAAHERKGLLLLQQRRSDEALAAFDRAVRFDARNVGAAIYAGLIETDLERWEAAIARLEPLVAQDPNQALAWIALGRALAEIGRLERSRAALERAQALAPDDRRLAAVIARVDELERVR